MAVLNRWADLTCPDGCDEGLDFGALSVNQNCVEIPNLSQISDLYIIPDGAVDAFNYSPGPDPTLVSGGIDNTVLDNSKTKWLVGKGGMAEPEETLYNGPKGSRAIIKRRYTMEFEVSVKSDDTRDFLRQLECNPKNFIFRFGTVAGYLYGGEEGITPAFTNARLSLGNGDEDYELGIVVLEWETDAGAGSAPRHVNPHASA